jgi:hypothetical protein
LVENFQIKSKFLILKKNFQWKNGL